MLSSGRELGRPDLLIPYLIPKTVILDPAATVETENSGECPNEVRPEGATPLLHMIDPIAAAGQGIPINGATASLVLSTRDRSAYSRPGQSD